MLSVRNLNVVFHCKERVQEIIRGVDFDVYTGKCLGILRESESGKSMNLKAIVGLLDQSFSVHGKVVYREEDLVRMGREGLRRIRGRRIAMTL